MNQFRDAGLHRWLDFIQGQSHLLCRMPEILFQQAANWPAGSPARNAAESRWQSRRERRPWLRRLDHALPSRLRLSLPTNQVTSWQCWFSADGSRLGAIDFNRLRHWDASTGKECESHIEAGWQFVQFCPEADLALVYRKPLPDLQLFHVIELPSGRHKAAVGLFSPSTVCAALSPDGLQLAAASGAELRLWDLAEAVADELGEPAVCGSPRVLAAAGGPLQSVAFSGDSRLVATGDAAGAIRVWDTRSGEHLVTLRGHEEPIWRCCFSAEGRTLVSSSYDPYGRQCGAWKLWDVASGTEIRELARFGRMQGEHAAAFSPDGSRLAYSLEQAVRVVTNADGKEVTCCAGHGYKPVACAFSPDGLALLTSAGGELRLWDLTAPASMVTSHMGAVRVCEFSEAGELALTGASDGSVLLWEVASATTQANWQHAGELSAGAVTSPAGVTATASEDVRAIVSGTLPITGATLTLRDASTEETRSGIDAHGYRVDRCLLSPDGMRLLTTTSREFTLWDVATGSELARDYREDDCLRAWEFDEDCREVIGYWRSGAIRRWDLESGEARPAAEKDVLALANLPSGAEPDRWGGAAPRLHASLVKEGGCVWRHFRKDQYTLGIVLDCTLPHAALIESRRPIRIVHRLSGASVAELHNPSDQVLAAAWGAGGGQLAALFQDATLRVWDTALEHPVAILPLESPGSCLAAHPVRPIFLVGCRGGSVVIAALERP